MTREAIFEHVQATIAELFELDVGDVRLDSTVFDELDLDSIDAIDLVAKLQQFSGQRIEEEQMRRVRQVGDLVDLLALQLRAGSPGESAAG